MLKKERKKKYLAQQNRSSLQVFLQRLQTKCKGARQVVTSWSTIEFWLTPAHDFFRLISQIYKQRQYE